MTWLGWVWAFLCRKMPDQVLPIGPYRCRYLERYYNRMVKEKEAAENKQKKKEAKEKKKQAKEKKEVVKKQKKKGKQKKVFHCLTVYLLASPIIFSLQTLPQGPKARKTNKA